MKMQGLTYIAIFVAIYYLFAPIFSWFRQTHQQYYTRRPVEIDDLPPVAVQGIRQMVDELVPLGFQVASHTFNSKPVPRVHSGIILFLNRTSGDIAQGIYTIGHVTLNPVATNNLDSTLHKKSNWMFVFQSKYISGRSIATKSSRTASVFPINPRCDSINVNWLSSPAEIYQIHRARVKRFGAEDLCALPNPGEEIAYLDAESAAEMQRVVDVGYYWLDAPAKVYRLTLKGAYLMTWRLLPPWRQLRKANQRRKALRELRSARQRIDP
ncbi:MAG TPA: hypothetical protein VFE58_10280 [Tepidisphaeraceae bacterium]|jgi:hypothetical protein|nr:hypothetical protein [Tepidisphaeraceae bacterium]